MNESEPETQNLYVKGPRVARACKPRAQEMEMGVLRVFSAVNLVSLASSRLVLDTKKLLKTWTS